MKTYYFLVIIVFLLSSCSSEKKQGDLPEIPVDIEQSNPLSLSEITEEITTIGLELTDESIINPDEVGTVIISGNDVYIACWFEILVFNNDGKFVRSIGSKGQGPGEFSTPVSNLAIDERNNHLFALSGHRIFCYDLTGKFLKVSRPFNSSSTEITMFYPEIIDYINDELLISGNKVFRDADGSRFVSSMIYRLNDDFQITDSFTVRNNYYEGGQVYQKPKYRILKGNTSVYMYYSELYRILSLPGVSLRAPAEVVLRDTLYRFEKNLFVPDLKLKFKNDGISNGHKFIDLFYIYRSSRYVFSNYQNNLNENKYYFCYDTKTGKGYNMQDGFTDDINGIDKPVKIRPFSHDTEMFYYLHTNMNPGDLEEPNPTLYIGKLKK